MAQTKEGAIKLAAKNYGLTTEEYLLKIATHSYCNKCKAWKEIEAFSIDKSRTLGIHKNCIACRRRNNGIRGKPFKKGVESAFKGRSHKESVISIFRANNAGSRNPNWKGGTTKLIMQIRNLAEFKTWRMSVYKAGKFTCSKCGTVKSGNNITLDADHIVPLSKLVALYNITTTSEAISTPDLWDIANGRCLCRSCHKQTPTWGVNANKTIKNGKI